MNHSFFALSLLFIFSFVVSETQARTVRLLSIGNSFSRNATRHLSNLAKAGGHELIHHPIIVGGASLEVHAAKAQAHEAKPEGDLGRYADGTSLKERLREQPWDFVTIQQASLKSHDYSTFQPIGSWLADFIRQHAPGARLMVHQTWAYRADDPRFTKTPMSEDEPVTRAEMHAGLTAAYEQLAAETKAGLLPVGDAFDFVERDPEWGYRVDKSFDFAEAKYPDLPNQKNSLHVGWRWTKKAGQNVLSMDGHHANLAGEYLGACVWYEVFFEADCTGLDFVPTGLDPEHARFLRATAHHVAATRREQATVIRPMPAHFVSWELLEYAGGRMSAGDRVQSK